MDWLIKNNGWDTKYNIVSTWKYGEPILKKVRFEKKFTPYLHFIVFDSEAILALLNEDRRPDDDLTDDPIDDLTYLSRHITISVAVHDTLSKEHVNLVNENPEHLIEQFI